MCFFCHCPVALHPHHRAPLPPFLPGGRPGPHSSAFPSCSFGRIRHIRKLGLGFQIQKVQGSPVQTHPHIPNSQLHPSPPFPAPCRGQWPHTGRWASGWSSELLPLSPNSWPLPGTGRTGQLEQEKQHLPFKDLVPPGWQSEVCRSALLQGTAEGFPQALL